MYNLSTTGDRKIAKGKGAASRRALTYIISATKVAD